MLKLIISDLQRLSLYIYSSMINSLYSYILICWLYNNVSTVLLLLDFWVWIFKHVVWCYKASIIRMVWKVRQIYLQ